MKPASSIALAGLLLASSAAAHAAPDEEALGKASGYPVQRFGNSFSMSALKTADVPGDIFVERNYFSGAVIKVLGGTADVCR
jgi:hypothetical protein